jgi:hypothetical protein
MAGQYFGSITTNGTLPNILTKPSLNAVPHIEVFINSGATGSPVATC